MSELFLKKRWYLGGALILIGIAVTLIVGVVRRDPPPAIIATVERGDVRELVSVSGIAEADHIAELAFPTGGVLATVPVREGDTVAADDVLATLTTNTLAADRQDALATLAEARATRAELLAGVTDETRAVSTETVTAKRTALSTTRETQERTVANARRTLLSSGLAAIATDPDEDATPPTVSGTYQCDATGRYTIDPYSSQADSGYSFNLSGLEEGTYPAATEQPGNFGSCGLRLQFDPDSRYAGSEWYIEIPNKKASTYTANRNAYELAQTNASTAIALAEQELALAQASAISDTAPARSEQIAKANAAVARAQARLARIDAQFADRTLRAPFAGTITRLDGLPGEAVTTQPIITLLAGDRYILTARVPEIDIGKLDIGQRAEVVFDTRDDLTLTATVDYSSPQATEIDGVAYYETRLTLDTQPAWLRSGLNADVDIIVDEASGALRIPKRFLTQTEDGTPAVRQKRGEHTATTTVEVILAGNDGYVAITGVSVGDTLIAP